MREADKRARILVAYGGLVLLSHRVSKDPQYKSTRAHLFAVPKDEDTSPELVKAIKTKDWQRDYIKRLIDAGLLERVVEGSQELYTLPDLREIDKIIADHDTYGLRLSRFLFPREAGIPQELEEDEEVVEPTEDKSPPEGAAEQNYDLQLSGKTVERLVGLLNGLHKQQEMNVALMKGVIDQYKLVEKALADKSHEVLDYTQADKDFHNFVKNKFKDLEQRLGKQEEATGFSARTLTRLDAGISVLAAAITPIVPKLSELLGLRDGQTLLKEIEVALSLYFGKLSKVDSGQQVLSELRSKIKDLSAIEDLAMRAIESMEEERGDR